MIPKNTLFIILLISSCLSAKNYQNINWINPNGNFLVEKNNISLNDTQAGSSKIFTEIISSENKEWEFDVEIKFNPSTNNYAEVYLLSTSNNLLDDDNIVLKIGKNKDKIELVEYNNKKATTIIESNEGLLNFSTNSFRIKISYLNNTWNIFTKQNDDDNYKTIGTKTYSTEINNYKYFGIIANYTSTRANKFAFRNFVFTNITSNNNLQNVADIKILNSQTFNITCTNETMLTKKCFNFSIKSIETNDNIHFTIITTDKFISGKYYNIEIKNMVDINGNLFPNSSTKKLYYKSEKHHIKINEIMFDPSPPIELAQTEYVEFINNTDGFVLLKNWTIEIGSKTITVDSLILNKNDFLIITHDSINTTDNSKQIISNITLNNKGATIKIFDNKNNIIDEVEYNSKWNNNDYKYSGGWSLELINPKNNCIIKQNWKYSDNLKGGTPGAKNSNYNLNYYPNSNAKYIGFNTNNNLTKLYLNFINFVNIDELYIETNYNSNYSTIKTNLTNGNSQLIIDLENEITSKTYFELDNLKNCGYGNYIKPIIVKIAPTNIADNNDIVINEILFNADKNIPKFIEFYNKSGKFINIKNYLIANFNQDNNGAVFEKEKYITSENTIIAPKSYFVVTTDIETLATKYTNSEISVFIEIESMPKLNIDEGKIALLLPNSVCIDKVYYTKNMHFALLPENNKKGISLERINPKINSIDINNWTTASEQSGGATPGLKNSCLVNLNSENNEEIIMVHPEVITPNLDGFNDVAQIQYNVKKEGKIANVFIYNHSGNLIKQIANNFLMSTEGSFIWDGCNSENAKVSNGIYIVLIEIFDLNGNNQTIKKIIVVA
ncbi:MAG: lamin tail domain-containing protein [Ichthyobacteriaceae bacterium]|nr:lamin tail domain-containing protein [Ichthyobacteriaceae bacterium]